MAACDLCYPNSWTYTSTVRSNIIRMFHLMEFNFYQNRGFFRIGDDPHIFEVRRRLKNKLGIASGEDFDIWLKNKEKSYSDEWIEKKLTEVISTPCKGESV